MIYCTQLINQWLNNTMIPAWPYVQLQPTSNSLGKRLNSNKLNRNNPTKCGLGGLPQIFMEIRPVFGISHLKCAHQTLAPLARHSDLQCVSSLADNVRPLSRALFKVNTSATDTRSSSKSAAMPKTLQLTWETWRV